MLADYHVHTEYSDDSEYGSNGTGMIREGWNTAAAARENRSRCPL